MEIDKQYFTIAYFFSALLFFVGLVFSNLLISISLFIFVGLILLEGNYKVKFSALRNNKSALFFISIFLFFSIGLLWTSNYNEGFNDLRIKLPLLLLPIVLVSTESFTKKDLYIILCLFSITIFAKTIESTWRIFDNNIENTVKNISHKISHITYSLYLIFSIFSLLFLYKKTFTKLYQRIIIIVVIIWFSFFIFVLQSFTGIFIFIFLTVSLLIYILVKKKKKIITIISGILALIFVISLSLYINKYIQSFIPKNKTQIENLEKYTQNGNLYTHNKKNIFIENGNKVGLYLCEKELKKEWNKRSKINYDSLDFSNNKIKNTLKRYLTSRGLRKDSLGASKLNNKEISDIEKGVTNYKYSNPLKLSSRIYKIIWQIHVYSTTKNPNDKSIVQRYEFLKTASHIINNNLLLGVGTGDVKDTFANQYKLENSKLRPENRLHAHNQIITIIITLGIILGLLTLTTFIIPFFINKKHKEYLPTIFFILIFLSMFTDDIFETSTSVSFISFFYSILILKKYNK